MTEPELAQLHNRIIAGEQPTEELWAMRRSGLEPCVDATTAEALADVWNLAFHHERLFPKLEAAKALVETALAANTSYPILTNDGLVYDALSRAERLDLIQFIRERVAQTEAPVAEHVLRDFVDDLLGDGPQV